MINFDESQNTLLTLNPAGYGGHGLQAHLDYTHSLHTQLSGQIARYLCVCVLKGFNCLDCLEYLNCLDCIFLHQETTDLACEESGDLGTPELPQVRTGECKWPNVSFSFVL